MVCSDLAEDRLLHTRYLFLGVVGSSLALFGLIANSLLATLFLTRAHYRHSPFFFLGFVALFDTLLDATYILLLSVPVSAEFYGNLSLFLLWLNYMPHLHLLGQVFKISSVLCLIMASIERYCMTRHWTFTGFERSTRWLVLGLLIATAIVVKNLTFDTIVVERPECWGFRRFRVGTQKEHAYHLGLVDTVAIFVPFFTLIFLNGGIVLMLRRQNVQQLRSLITELTMGHDVMKIRRRNLRSATRTLIVIISAYLISNLLNLFLTLTDYYDTDFLHVSHPDLYLLATDAASILTVTGNAIRCPAHFLSNSEIRQQFYLLFFGEVQPKTALTGLTRASIVPDEPIRRRSERLENPWISLLLTVHEKDAPNSPLLEREYNYSKRHSTIAIC